jgi:hypothetical protein
MHPYGLFGRIKRARDSRDASRLQGLNTTDDLLPLINFAWEKTHLEFCVDMTYTRRWSGRMFNLPYDKLEFARLSGFRTYDVHDCRQYAKLDCVQVQLAAWLGEVVALREELETGQAGKEGGSHGPRN